MPRYSTLLFDLDHTLFDSDASEAQAFAYAMDAGGVAEPARYFARYTEINRGLWAQVERGELPTTAIKHVRFERLVAEADLTADAAVLAEAFLVGMGQFGELYPLARPLLDALTARGDLTLGLLTNGLSEVQRARIARLELDGYFDAIVVSAEIGVAKPDPAFFAAALTDLGDPPRDGALMIGDSFTSDLRGARGAGVATCWYNPARRAPTDASLVDHEIAALTEVLALVA
jgi:YjjG family noncanonical pyrimidine nucleotidase